MAECDSGVMFPTWCHPSSTRGKLGLFSVTGLVISFLILAIIYGIKLLEVGSEHGSNSTDVINCVPLNGSCSSLTEEESDTSCCWPYICDDNENSMFGKCIEIAIFPNETTSTTTTKTPESGDCPYVPRLEQVVEPIREGEEFNEFLAYIKAKEEGYLKLSAYRGDPRRNCIYNLRELNLQARLHMSTTNEQVGKTIYPLIVATDFTAEAEGVGGTFTLYLENGSSQSVSPVSDEYEIRKGISHIPMGVYGILVPYFNSVRATGWRKPLAVFGEKIQQTFEATHVGLNLANNEKQLYDDSVSIMETTLSYISKWLHNTSKGYGVPEIINTTEFQEYAQEVFPIVNRSIQISAQIQMENVIPVLRKWKEELGEKWKDVYAVIPTIWPVRGMNPRFQAFVEVMGPQQAKNQVFILENVRKVEEMRNILGKIIVHRTAGHLIFGTKTKRSKQLLYSLAEKQDIMSIDAQDFIKSFYHQ